ncbi:MAG: succinate dehydrogenase, hydrophobic membrane anchor protein [Alphaproteobacteria bacterium]|nr:succinate dehydrogenase, hydrophobic membrane anchor protein [Alphaproteobacteria bacterium]
MKSRSKLTSSIARARGLGSAKDGVHHWWMQRLTAVLLVPLSIWFMVSLVGELAGANRVEVAAWLESPLVAVALAGMLVSGFWHAKLGIQVVIEDYIHHEWIKFGALFTNSFAFWAMGILSLFAVIKLHFFGI